MHDSAAKRTEIKEDFAQINSFRYGVLSIDAWKANIQKIVTDRVDEFQLTKEQKKILQDETSKVLNGLLAEADKVAKKPNSGLGKIKAHFAKSYIKAARQNLSRFSGTIIDQIEKPATLKKLKQMALEQFNTFAATTHSSDEDVAKLNWLLVRNHVTSAEEFNAGAQQKISDLSAQSFKYTMLLIGGAFLFGLAWWFVLKDPSLHGPFFTLSMVFAFVLLITSLSIPLMEI